MTQQLDMQGSTAGADAPITSTTDQAGAAGRSWRDVLPIHPAAELFPLMSNDELCALGQDIKGRGLQTAITIDYAGDDGWRLVDGRNRLDAMELVGLEILRGDGDDDYWDFTNLVPMRDLADTGLDAYAFVISANFHRRHLTAEQKRELIAKVLKATPEKSNRAIAETVKASPTTVGKVRAEMEPTVQSGQLKRVGKDGKARKQPKKRDLEKERAAREERKRERRGDLPSYEEMMAAADAERTADQAACDVALAQDDAERSAEARKAAYAADEAEAAAIETTKPPPANIAKAASTETKANAALVDAIVDAEFAGRLEVWALDFLDALVEVAGKHPDWVDAGELGEDLQTLATAFTRLAQQRARPRQGGD